MIPERLNELVENFMLVIAVMTTVIMLAVQSFLGQSGSDGSEGILGCCDHGVNWMV